MIVKYKGKTDIDVLLLFYLCFWLYIPIINILSSPCSSPIRSPVIDNEIIMMNTLYKERFPKVSDVHDFHLYWLWILLDIRYCSSIFYFKDYNVTFSEFSTFTIELLITVTTVLGFHEGKLGVGNRYGCNVEILLFFQATQQMEERLNTFIEDNKNLEEQGSSDIAQDAVAIARFVHHQVLEMAKDCLEKSQQKLITSRYFYELSENLEKLLCEVSVWGIALLFTWFAIWLDEHSGTRRWIGHKRNLINSLWITTDIVSSRCVLV